MCLPTKVCFFLPTLPHPCTPPLPARPFHGQVIAPDGILAFDYVVPPTANFGLPGALLHIVLFRTDPAVSAGKRE